MAISRIRVWAAGDVLTAADLNNEFNNIINNALALVSPLTANLDAGGFSVVSLGLGSAAAPTLSPTGQSATGIYFPTTTGVGVSQAVATSGSPVLLTLTGSAHTSLAASTEASDVIINLGRTVQFATGPLTTQRAVRIQAPTYSAVGVSTITNADTLHIDNAPIAGANVTITNRRALHVAAGVTQLDGILSMNASTLLSAVDGDIALTNNRAYRIVNSFGNNAISVLSLNTLNRLDLGTVGVGMRFAWQDRVAATVPANFAANFRILVTDNTGNNFFIPGMDAGW